jgi:hypothetical protein
MLCIEDEPNVLHAFEREFRKRFELHTALERSGGPGGRGEHRFSSDRLGPADAGHEWHRVATRARRMALPAVRVMPAGQADLSAINLAGALSSASEQYRLIVGVRNTIKRSAQYPQVRVLLPISNTGLVEYKIGQS